MDIKRIGIITRDCAGVNAAIRSVVRTAHVHNIETFGILKGYDGLIDKKFVKLNRSTVSGIINKGGTILKTARSKRFYEEKYQRIAVKNIKEMNLDALIVIGGNGSLTGAHILHSKYDIPIVGIPATIDNDISFVDKSIGADTALNVALDALDKIRDTATSLERIFIVEVMGRNCGYIALQLALAGGCEEVLVPEKEIDIEFMCNEIKKGNEKGKISWIIIVAEGKAKASDIANMITEKTGFETRIAVLGHIQRGGRPNAADRIMGARLGNFAVENLMRGETDICVYHRDGKYYTVGLEAAIKTKQIDVDEYIRLIRILT